MINLKKNDAIADVVRGIMEKELKGNQTKLDKNHNGKLDSQDFKILRGQKKATEDVEAVEEGKQETDKDFVERQKRLAAASSETAKDPKRLERLSKIPGYSAAMDLARKTTKEDVEQVEENAFDYKSPRPIEPKGGSGVKQGSRYGGSKQKEKPEQEEPKEQMTLKKMKEKYEEPIIDELINEVLSKDADAGDYIHDFVHSDNPKFAGKSKAERKKMALGAYYAKKNEEYVEEGMLKTVAKKAFKALTGGSDEDQLRALQKRAGAPVTGKKPEPKKEEVEHIEEGLMTGITLGKKVKNDDGGHDQDVHHKGKKIGIISSYAHRTGTRYGMNHNASGDATAGARSHEEALGDLRQSHAEHLKSMKKEEVAMESKGPTSQMDEPFVTDAENKPLNNAKVLASKTLKRMKSEMLGKAGTSE